MKSSLGNGFSYNQVVQTEHLTKRHLLQCFLPPYRATDDLRWLHICLKGIGVVSIQWKNLGRVAERYGFRGGSLFFPATSAVEVKGNAAHFWRTVILLLQ